MVQSIIEVSRPEHCFLCQKDSIERVRIIIIVWKPSLRVVYAWNTSHTHVVQRPQQSQSDQTKQLLEKGGKKKQGRPGQGRDYLKQRPHKCLSSKLSMISAVCCVGSVFFFNSNLELTLLTSVIYGGVVGHSLRRNLQTFIADEVIINVWIFKNNLLSFFPFSVWERWQVFMRVFVAE